MKKCFIAVLLSVFLLLSACAPAGSVSKQGEVRIACTAYPVYCLTQGIVGDTEGFEVQPVVTDVVSCIHDYTLTITNMKVIDSADVLVLCGAGLEENMEDALSFSSAPVIEAADGIETFLNDEGETDPHLWLDPGRACRMAQNICSELCSMYPESADCFQANCDEITAVLNDCLNTGRDMLSDLDCRYMINFHDGFAYFAEAFGLEILDAVEEEAGSEASAKAIIEICDEIRDYDIPAIFTEVNGSTATAAAISRETGCKVLALSTLMSTKDADLDGIGFYVNEMNNNFEAVKEALS